MNPGLLNKRIELWQNVPQENELHEQSYQPTLVKTIWGQIVPKTGSLISGREAGTMLSKTTHVVRMRYGSVKGITPAHWLIYREGTGAEEIEHKFTIDYIQNPLWQNDQVEVYCQEVVT